MRRINQELEEKKRAEGVQSGPSELSANHVNEIPELMQDSFQQIDDVFGNARPEITAI